MYICIVNTKQLKWIYSTKCAETSLRNCSKKWLKQFLQKECRKKEECVRIKTRKQDKKMSGNQSDEKNVLIKKIKILLVISSYI